MMRVTKEDLKLYVNILILTFIMYLINFKINISFISVNVDVYAIVFAILMQIKFSKYAKEYKSVKIMIILAWAYLASCLINILLIPLYNNILPTLEYVGNLGSSSDLTPSMVNEIFLSFNEIKDNLVITTGVSILIQEGMKIALVYFIGKTLIAFCEDRKLEFKNQINNRFIKWCIIDGTLGLVLILIVYFTLSMMSTFRVDENFQMIIDSNMGSSMIIIFFLFILLIVAGIYFLVNLVKIFSLLNKISKANEQSFDQPKVDNVIGY